MEFDDSKVVDESKFVWFPVGSTDRKEIINEIQIQELNLQDRPLQFSSLTEQDMEIFTISKTGDRPFEFDNSRVHMALSYEMNLDLIYTEREVYSLFDWVGDLGGLHDGVRLFFVACIAFFNYNYYSAYMVSQLFAMERKALASQSGPDESSIARIR